MRVMEGATRRRTWAEHPASLPVSVSWALWGLGSVIYFLIADAPAWGWGIFAFWLLLNGVATFAATATLTTALEKTPSGSKAEQEQIEQGTSLWRDAGRRLRRNLMATLSMVILGLIVLLCFGQYAAFQLVPVIAKTPRGEFAADSFYARHIDHTRTHEGETFQPPSTRHWFGTDTLGRDLFARTLFGGSVSFLVGLVGTLVSVTVGIAWGSIAGYLGGRVDDAMMRIVDILYGLPFLFLVILIMTLVNGLGSVASETEQKLDEISALVEKGELEKAKELESEVQPQARVAVTVTRWMPPIVVVFVAIGLVSWLTMARIVRGQVLSLREREFVVAARSIGASVPRIIFRHLVPNLLGPVIVYSTLTIPEIMLSEAFLSFVGLGISEPNCSWGSLASEGLAGVNIIKPYWWLLAYPAAALSISLFCLNFIGDGLRDALDPRAAK